MTQKKSNKKQVFMSIVALILIIIVGAGVTYSWIEEGKNYSVQTNKAIQIEKDNKIDTLSYGSVITLDPDSSNSKLNILKYDETSNQYQDLFFSPVYSIDGRRFIFPVTDSEGKVSSYRNATTNDIGTKYISFDYDVKAVKNCIVAFNKAPTITAAKNGNSDIDTSAFRIMISDGNSNPIVFSTADTAQVTNVRTDIYGSNSTLTTKTFENYIYNQTTNNKLFEFSENNERNIKVSVWVDAGANPAQLAALQGCNITVDIELIVVKR